MFIRLSQDVFWSFVVLNTTSTTKLNISLTLWFAFIFEISYYWTQLKWLDITPSFGCDLLSFLKFRTIEHNNILQIGYTRTSCDLLSFLKFRTIEHNCRKRCIVGLWVVICFHFWNFVVLNTTRRRKHSTITELWFAFIFEIS